MVLAYLLTASYVALATWSVLRLSALHPAQLWALPWALACCMYSLRLLPYKPLGALTVVLAAGAGAAFCGAALWGERLSRRAPGTLLRREPPQVIRLAAMAAAGIAAVSFVAFLGQVAGSFGLRNTLLASIDVRLAIGEGAFPVTIKYVYPAIAAAILAAAVSATEPDGNTKLIWIGVSLLAIASLFFSTGRSTIVLAALAALLAYVLSSRVLPRTSVLLAGTYCVLTLTLAAHVGLGELQGRFLAGSPATAVPSAMRGGDLEVLALPYEYASAPLPALNERVEAANTIGGSNGCASLRAVCNGLARAGIGEEGRPPVLGFTGKPLFWNTYTALDLPLSDGGVLLALPILALTGLIVGFAWGVAIRGSSVGIFAYALLGTCAIFTVVQYNFLASHVIGAGVLTVGLLLIASLPLTNTVRGRLKTA